MKSTIKFLLKNIPRPVLIKLSPIITKIFPFFLKGDAVHCSICNNSFSRFLAYGINPRPNALCPKCLSLERHRLLWLYFKSKTDFFEKHYKVLHVAPEQVFYKIFKKQRNLDYTTIDLESPLADIKMNVEQMTFGDSEFDIVLCNHVLEHVENDDKALKEIFRVLKKGGYAILQSCIDYNRLTTYEDKTITSEEDREREFWQKDHCRLYGMDYSERLKKAGFVVDENLFVNELSKEEVNRYRLMKEEIIFIGKKL
jgi:SAM-dependent methyltransferase